MSSLVKIYGWGYNCRWYKIIFSQECIDLEAHFRYIAMGYVAMTTCLANITENCFFDKEYFQLTYENDLNAPGGS
jgi:hypothetical protein